MRKPKFFNQIFSALFWKEFEIKYLKKNKVQDLKKQFKTVKTKNISYKNKGINIKKIHFFSYIIILYNT